MSDKTKKIIRALSSSITIVGVCGLGIAGAAQGDMNNVVKVGTMIASVIGSIVTLALPRNK